MKKKIYITTELPDYVKDYFRDQESRWKNLKVFWTGFSHLRLRIGYLGVVDKKELIKITEALEEAVADTPKIKIKLDRIVLGPNEKEPKMFWATILDSRELNEFIKNFLEKLEEAGFDLEKIDKNFIPHIILANAKGNQLKGKKTNVPLKEKFEIEKIDLFSTQTYSKNFTKYKLVESFELKK